jgi:Uma2 family endonuclease
MNIDGMLLRAQQAGYGQGFVARTDVVRHSTEAAVEPHLLFIAANRLHIVTEERIEGAPDFIVEVLSSSTRDRDLGRETPPVYPTRRAPVLGG